MNLDELTDVLGGVPLYKAGWIQNKGTLSGQSHKRMIHNPNDAMKLLHRRLIFQLRMLGIEMPYAVGARPFGSPRKNVERHCGNRYFYVLDLTRAYGHVQAEKLARIICQVDRRPPGEEKVLDFLKAYCLIEGEGLAIGAPASPDLFNLYASRLLDLPLAKLAKQYDLTYSRYLDDLVFSGKQQAISSQIRREIRQIIAEADFEVSHHKSRVLDLAKGPIFINGIGLRLNGEIFIPRSFVNKLHGLLHRATTVGGVNWAVIEGMMGVFKSVTPESWENKNKTEQRISRAYRSYRQKEEEWARD